jgi:hypothetical protein
MSEENKGVLTQVSLLDQVRQQHSSFIMQRDQAQINLNQLIGAIYACDLMIKKHEDDAKKQDVSNEGDQGNGETVEQEQVETP